MKTMTLKEGVLRMLDGEKISIMVPQDLGTTWLDDLPEMQKLGAFCVFTEDLGIGKPDLEEQPEPEPEPEKTEESPKKPKIDVGRIRALADAGWSVQKIAEDMKISAPTVRRYLKEGGEG